jgi:uncharacterized SAM-binding protein YcdF (DUF218 family)
MLSLPLVAQLLIWPLEAGLPLNPPPGPLPRAIVILGGDVSDGADGDTSVGALTLERLRAGARLGRKLGLPILVTGGPLGRAEVPLAVLMARSLAEDFAVPTAWLEPAAKDTWENAQLSGAILRQQGIDSVYLVTHPWHMRRSLMAFGALPVSATAAPTGMDAPPSWAWRDLVPQVSAWRTSYFALHEWIGCIYYALRR